MHAEALVKVLKAHVLVACAMSGKPVCDVAVAAPALLKGLRELAASWQVTSQQAPFNTLVGSALTMPNPSFMLCICSRAGPSPGTPWILILRIIEYQGEVFRGSSTAPQYRAGSE